MDRSSGRSAIAARAAELASPLAEALGLELVGVWFGREHGRQLLRVTIDRPGGVRLSDCEALSEALSRRLDEVDPIPGPYHLEVSSPGPRRPLVRAADYERFAGRRVRIELTAPHAGRRRWQGELLGLAEGEIRLSSGGQEVALPLAAVRRARLCDPSEE